MHGTQVSEPPKKLLKWRKKLQKAKNQVTIPPVLTAGRQIVVKNFVFKVGSLRLHRRNPPARSARVLEHASHTVCACKAKRERVCGCVSST
jgi:hypothetical protein